MLKIAVVGPESTGKSTMSAYLAKHYQTVWVPEYAREYCEKLSEAPTVEDEVKMFWGQIALEKEIIQQANTNILICDTTILTVKIWCDALFGYTPVEVLDELPRHYYDLYLLMDIDLPWQDDPLRDFPTRRPHFMNVWQQELQALNARYVIISGSGQQRYDRAIKAVEAFRK